MASTAFIINQARKNITTASQIIEKALAEIAGAQNNCKHDWRFNRQTNAHHVERWFVTYKCPECDLERTEEKPPVCEVDDTPLVRASPDDAEAETEREKPEYAGHDNPPIAFRCPTCQRIHILWLKGD